ncbi:hypothetical protein Y032_0017g3337 [Ancylostoma ceylanicum]|uniref:2Fe-2S ferredoxin-type domain-containing protein n=1 Tax=Ancylostoma ceylanicum TaxID=53326 RepID=A0A016V418_9BILA|nr:hypothetical protein Y032_0017g3337 [Ancylostoma ceylanicum]
MLTATAKNAPPSTLILHIFHVPCTPHFSGTLACCTCHVILSPQHYERVDRLNPAGEEEMDLLDLAPELSDYSRLGCQVSD